jgi:transcriptional regulator with XRE-family HTH domain
MSNLGNREVFAKNLKRYLDNKGRTQKEVAEFVGVATSTFNDWMKGKKYPRMDKIERLANYFGILKSDLIEDKGEAHFEMQQKNSTLVDLTLRMRRDSEFLSIIEMIDKLNPEQLNHIKQSASLLLKLKD